MTLAIYTTVYPAAKPYLSDWYSSVQRQTDQEFELWIGLDNLESSFTQNILGSTANVNWVRADPGDSPAQIRQRALAKIVETCSSVVLVDSDDILHSTRISAAREKLEGTDLVACALRLVDEHGNDLGLTFNLPSDLVPEDVFPRNNVFGFSNSAFRSELLQRCLPIPEDAVLVDWFLATRAWLLGVKMLFDREPRMDYRQHANNAARVRVPFGQDQVISDTTLVRKHFQLLLAGSANGVVAERYDKLLRVTKDVDDFYCKIVLEPTRLSGYVRALNALKPWPMWWTCVAFPALAYMWS